MLSDVLECFCFNIFLFDKNLYIWGEWKNGFRHGYGVLECFDKNGASTVLEGRHI